MEEYGANYITITDEDGKPYEMEILARFEYLDKEYMALIPADEDPDAPTSEVNLLRIEEDDEEEILVAIEDEDELNGAYEALMELVYEEDDD